MNKEVSDTSCYKLVFIFIFLFWQHIESNKENVILVIADDLGIDFMRPYGFREDAVPMPYIEELIENGILFTKYYTYPSCSPVRASMLTGRYGFRTGTRCAINQFEKNDPNGIHLDEFTIPHALSGMNIKNAALGKWHMQTRFNGKIYNPHIMGFDHYSGHIHGTLSLDYFTWYKTVDDQQYVSFKYATIDLRDDTIAWLQENKNDQFFLWLAFNAPHFPYHKPPNELHTYHDLEPIEPLEYGLDPVPWYKAMIQSLDTVLKQILQSLDEDVFKRTNIIFVGDNAEDSRVSHNGYFDPFKVKFSLYDSAVNVPMFIYGPRVTHPGTRTSAMVASVDIFDTILDIFECQNKRIENHISDSISFLPVIEGRANETSRKYRFSEQGKGTCKNHVIAKDNLGFTIADKKYKLWCYNNETEKLYDIENDPFEDFNLLANEVYNISDLNDIYKDLKNELLNLLQSEFHVKKNDLYFGLDNQFALY